MYTIKKWNQFKKDFKKIIHDNSKKEELKKVLNFLIKWEKLPEKYKDHSLKWKYIWFRECHVKPDFLLIYKFYEDKLILALLRLWNHNELF